MKLQIREDEIIVDRRKNFSDTLAHRQPEQLILDFGGNPLSTMEGESENKLLDFLGFEKNRNRFCFLERPEGWIKNCWNTLTSTPAQ